MNLNENSELCPLDKHNLINQSTKINIAIDMILSGNYSPEIVENTQRALNELSAILEKIKD